MPSSLLGGGTEAPGRNPIPGVLAEAVEAVQGVTARAEAADPVGARRAQPCRDRGPGCPEPEARPKPKSQAGEGGCGQSGWSLRPGGLKPCLWILKPTLRLSLEAQGRALIRGS